MNAEENNGEPVVVFMDVAIAGRAVGRVEIELFGDCPRACENFRQFCTGQFRGGRLGQAVGYKGTTFHRVERGFVVQGGDFVSGDGSGRASIYGLKFEDEAPGLARQVDSPGLLCMANTGPDTNGCQFFVTLAPCPSLTGRHVCFGRVRNPEGMLVVHAIEGVPVAPGGRPRMECKVVECGQL